MQFDGFGPIHLDAEHGASNTSSIQVDAPPQRQDAASEELDAIIEEARRRARRRRLGYLAAAVAVAITAGGILLVFGGDDGGGDGGAVSGDPEVPPVSGSNSSSSSYRCPTSMKVLEAALPGRGIPGCEVTFSAALPAGWDQGPARMIIYPPGLVGALGADVRYANFSLDDAGYTGKWPIYRMPPDGVSIGIFPQEPVSRAEVAAAPIPTLRPSDFHDLKDDRGDPGTTIDLFLGGRRYEVQVRTESHPVSELLEEANSVLNSIQVAERLCPCEGATGAIGPPR